MVALTWDGIGDRLYETGVDHGVLYPQDSSGDYPLGVPWNGLTKITESPSGADSNKQYADNQIYLNLTSLEEFGGTIEAWTYPDEFGVCDGTAQPSPGVFVGQQTRKTFGLAYRTLIGNDVDDNDHGTKLHLVWGAKAAPSSKDRETVNDTPAPVAFSWDFSTIPVIMTEINPDTGKVFKPTAYMCIDSTTSDAEAFAALEDMLFGSEGGDAHLPTPDEVVQLFGAVSLTEVRLVGANAPTYNSGTHVVTLPAVTGIQWQINGVNKANGAQPALTSGQTAVVTPVPASGYVVTGDNDWVFDY